MIQDKKLDFCGIGASKCGTSWISQCLYEHPDIFMPDTIHNRADYFYKDQLYRADLENFWELFQNAPENKVIGEYSPRYYIYENGLRKLKYHFPDVKIIISLRDPVERLISQYKFFVLNRQYENVFSLKKALKGKHFYEDYINKSLYFRHLKLLYDIFPSENIKVVFFEDIQNKPESLISQLYSFLGVDNNFIPPSLKLKLNKTRNVEEIPPYIHLTLNKALYKPDYMKFIPRKKLKKIKYYYDKWQNFRDELGIKLVKRKKLKIGNKIKEDLYKKYFKEDILRLEDFLMVDVGSWKKE